MEEFGLWKETAWNGIRFEVPDSFALERIGPRYLVLGTEAGPKIEFKWDCIRGTFSQSAMIRRLIEANRKQNKILLESSPLPENWKSALKGFEASGFIWEGRSIKGRGLILYCPDCRNATLIQFYHPREQPFEELDRRILASFRDHRSDGQIVWSVFDIRAMIPIAYALKRYRFEPGRFELSFVSGSSSVTLYRWSPAAVLLSGRSLESFIEKTVHLPLGRGTKRVEAEEKRVEFFLNEASAPAWWRAPLSANRICRVQAWHDDRSNRILGVRFEAKPPEFEATYPVIVSRYETRS